MFSTLPLRRGQEEFELCRSVEDSSNGALRFYDPLSALVFLREVITDSSGRHDLRQYLMSVNSSFEMYLLNDDNLLEHAARLIASGQLVVAGMEEEGGAQVEGENEGFQRKGGSVLVSQVETTPRQDEEARSEETATQDESEEEAAAEDEASEVTEVQPAESTWIALELLDSIGNPVPNERFKITMPDGSIKYGRLDGKGKARIEKLQPGTCQVTFPDRDEEVWEVG